MKIVLYMILVLGCALYQVAWGSSLPRPDSSVFSDLSVDEINGILEYLFKQSNIQLVPHPTAKLTDAAIFLIEAIRPKKAEALKFLDNSGARPLREARVVIHRGDLPTPIIEEYRVSPIPSPTMHELIKNPTWRDPIPFNSRSIINVPELNMIVMFIEREVMKINDILSEMTGGWTMKLNCTSRCLTWSPGLPPYVSANHHKLTPYLLREVEGAYLNPIGVQFVINIESMDVDQWFVEHVWFQGQRFKDFNQVIQAKQERKLRVTKVPDPEHINTKYQMSSLNFRGEPRPTASKRGPRSFMPERQRFTVSDRHVKWMGWDFEFSMLASSGIGLHNVKFLKERIAYELSLQEVGIFYSGGSPVASHSTYYDSLVILGLMTSELFPSIDCPNHAQFFDVLHYMNGKPHVFKNSVCVFEHDRGIPLRRHYSSDHAGSYHYVQGMPDNVLVLRQVLTVYNYDYIIDFMFHQAGQVEGKVSLTGYLLNTHYTGPEMNKYGHVLNEPLTIANIHHHIVHVKADLDIIGQKNRFATLDINLEEIRDEINTDQTFLNRYFIQSLKKTEMQAAYRFNFTTPKYLVMYNENAKNKFGNSRGYRIVSDAFSKILLPKEYRGFKARAWAEYQVAVTKHKNHEQCSSSIYATMEPYDPVMSFEDFIKDDEDIVDQDLVAWIAMGAHHIPHSEDVPIVTTPGVQLTFYLLPYNYFDEDPSLASRDNIRVTPINGGHKYDYAGVTPDHSMTDGSCEKLLPGSGAISLMSSTTMCVVLITLSLHQYFK